MKREACDDGTTANASPKRRAKRSLAGAVAALVAVTKEDDLPLLNICELGLATAAADEATISSDHNATSNEHVELEDEKDSVRDLHEAGPSRGAPTLPWMRVPLAIEGGAAVPLHDVLGLQSSLKLGLSDAGFTDLFPVQAATWQQLAGGHSQAHDLCISAPTGSGKTLAYALPILSTLTGRHARGPRALVVLPTRDLASQVFKVFSLLSEAALLTTLLIAGKLSQAIEARLLVPDCGSEAGHAPPDIIVATPGRLVAHLESTPGFSLADLRFLVVDEADRLLRQSYQEWLPTVTSALASQQAGYSWQRRCVKIVASATLTRDPSKIERLSLHCPRYVAVSASDYRHKLPRQLVEHKLMCKDAGKPMTLLALLVQLAGSPTIVFSASVQTTHRLFTFLNSTAALSGKCVEISSRLTPAARSANLTAFASGAATVLVASDAMTRGMDVDNVATVINYDAPVYAKTYVHRCGRTARAGKPGQAVTILRKEDMRHFKAMLRKVDNTYVRDFALDVELIHGLQQDYDQALATAQAAAGMQTDV